MRPSNTKHQQVATSSSSAGLPLTRKNLAAKVLADTRLAQKYEKDFEFEKLQMEEEAMRRRAKKLERQRIERERAKREAMWNSDANVVTKYAPQPEKSARFGPSSPARMLEFQRQRALQLKHHEEEYGSPKNIRKVGAIGGGKERGGGGASPYRDRSHPLPTMTNQSTFLRGSSNDDSGSNSRYDTTAYRPPQYTDKKLSDGPLYSSLPSNSRFPPPPPATVQQQDAHEQDETEKREIVSDPPLKNINTATSSRTLKPVLTASLSSTQKKKQQWSEEGNGAGSTRIYGNENRQRDGEATADSMRKPVVRRLPPMLYPSALMSSPSALTAPSPATVAKKKNQQNESNKTSTNIGVVNTSPPHLILERVVVEKEIEEVNKKPAAATAASLSPERGGGGATTITSITKTARVMTETTTVKTVQTVVGLLPEVLLLISQQKQSGNGHFGNGKKEDSAAHQHNHNHSALTKSTSFSSSRQQLSTVAASLLRSRADSFAHEVSEFFLASAASEMEQQQHHRHQTTNNNSNCAVDKTSSLVIRLGRVNDETAIAALDVILDWKLPLLFEGAGYGTQPQLQQDQQEGRNDFVASSAVETLRKMFRSQHQPDDLSYSVENKKTTTVADTDVPPPSSSNINSTKSNEKLSTNDRTEDGNEKEPERRQEDISLLESQLRPICPAIVIDLRNHPLVTSITAKHIISRINAALMPSSAKNNNNNNNSENYSAAGHGDADHDGEEENETPERKDGNPINSLTTRVINCLVGIRTDDDDDGNTNTAADKHDPVDSTSSNDGGSGRKGQNNDAMASSSSILNAHKKRIISLIGAQGEEDSSSSPTLIAKSLRLHQCTILVGLRDEQRWIHQVQLETQRKAAEVALKKHIKSLFEEEHTNRQKIGAEEFSATTHLLSEAAKDKARSANATQIRIREKEKAERDRIKQEKLAKEAEEEAEANRQREEAAQAEKKRKAEMAAVEKQKRKQQEEEQAQKEVGGRDEHEGQKENVKNVPIDNKAADPPSTTKTLPTPAADIVVENGPTTATWFIAGEIVQNSIKNAVRASAADFMANSVASSTSPAATTTSVQK